MLKLALLLLALLALTAEAFHAMPGAAGAMTHTKQTRLFGYKDSLAKAKAAKQNRGSGARQVQAQQPASPAPQATQAASAAPTEAPKKKRKSNNGLPFDDEIYNHMKFVMEKLGQRMRNEEALSYVELNRLETAVEAIIADSRI